MDFMARALELAHRSLGNTSPNPAVGAVVVRDGRIVGEGFTQPAGQDHAEVVALREAGGLATGSTMYVTLEPCAHRGRTPPCTDAIVNAGIAKVVYSLIDPNPLVSGKGRQQLMDAGIELQEGEGAGESSLINEAYAKFISTGLPFVTAKFATSLDGKIATRTGDSRWITGEEARREAHLLRSVSDAVMVGIGTVLADDPQLTARDEEGEPFQRQPARVIVDSSGRVPETARLFRAAGNTFIAGSAIPRRRAERLVDLGAAVISVPGGRGRVDLRALLQELGRRQIASVLVEGGGALLGALCDEGLVDKVVAFIAPMIIGGTSATGAVGGEGAAQLSGALCLENVQVRCIGGDIMVTGYPGCGMTREPGKR